ncbi:MAG: hypothetical protein V1722_01545 [Candidatus Micrarchaeota archaeon]
MTRNITLSIPEETFDKMKQFPEVRWSEIVRKAVEDRVDMLETLNRIASKSKLTESDVKELSEKIKQGMRKRHEGTK